MRYISIASGSSGNSHFIREGSDALLIDAGLSGKQLEQNLAHWGESLKDCKGIFLSHEHMDHIKGAGILSRRHDLPIFATEGTWQAMGQQMSKVLGKIKEEHRRTFRFGESLHVGAMTIKSFATSHDAACSCGFTVESEGRKLAIATDLGCIDETVFRSIQHAQLAVLEANYNDHLLRCSAYPYSLKQRIRSDVGHLSNQDCAVLACALAKQGTQKIFLAHLSKENNHPLLAYQEIEHALAQESILATQVQLTVLPRYEAAQPWDV